MTINEQLHNSAFHKGHEAACPVCNPIIDLAVENELEALREAARIVRSAREQVTDDDAAFFLQSVHWYLGNEAEELNLYLKSMVLA